MQDNTSDNTNGIQGAAMAINGYLSEVRRDAALCERHKHTTAIHDRGKTLQVYRMYPRSEKIVHHIREAVKHLDSWEKSLFWQTDHEALEKLRAEVSARTGAHTRQHSFLDHGVSWNKFPVLIHGYKFEPDPHIKIELIVPSVTRDWPELPSRPLTRALECHDYLVPASVATPLAPWSGHETDSMLTIPEHLARVMPEKLYATHFFHA